MSITPKEFNNRQESMARLLKQIPKGSTVMDELVHEAKAQEAADINNEGQKAQADYLAGTWGWKETNKSIREALGLPNTDVVIDATDQHIKCRHCGASQLVPTPMEVRKFAQWIEDWTKPHEEGACLKAQESK